MGSFDFAQDDSVRASFLVIGRRILLGRIGTAYNVTLHAPRSPEYL